MAEKTKKAKKANVFMNIAKFFRECKGEIKKITWPTMRQTTKNWGIVLVVILVAGLFICGLDYGLNALLNLVMNTAA